MTEGKVTFRARIKPTLEKMFGGSSDEKRIGLRPATEADEAFLLEVYGSTRDELSLLDWDDSQKLAFVRMQFEARRRQYSQNYPQAISDIILLDEQPVGSMLVGRSHHENSLVDIALLPEYRSAGIGTGLIQALLAEAGGEKKTMRLHVLAGSAAVRLYERLGFVKTDSDGIYLEMIWQS